MVTQKYQVSGQWDRKTEWRTGKLSRPPALSPFFQTYFPSASLFTSILRGIYMLPKTAFGFGPLFVLFLSTLLCIYESIYKNWYLSFLGGGDVYYWSTWHFNCISYIKKIQNTIWRHNTSFFFFFSLPPHWGMNGIVPRLNIKWLLVPKGGKCWVKSP